MSTTDKSALVRYPGRLCLNPTSAVGTFPYGGKSLGLAVAIALVVTKHVERVTEEALGVKVTLDALDMGETWGIAAILRAPDQGLIENFFMANAVGLGTGEKGVIYPGATNMPINQPGVWLGARGLKLLFDPFDRNQWPVFFPKIAPHVEEQARMEKSALKKWGVPVAFEALPPDDGSETAQWRPREDMVLS